MSKKPPCYKVVAASGRVTIHRIAPDSAEYPGAAEKAFQRNRDVLEMMRKKRESGRLLGGTAYFANLSLAKDYALLNLKALEDDLDAAYKAIEQYNGRKAASA